MDWQGIEKEAKALAYSFVGVVVAAAGTAALNWIGAHIPDAVTFLTQLAAGYGGAKMSS